MEELVIRLIIPWLLRHPTVFAVLLYTYTGGFAIGEAWMRIPESWRVYVKYSKPRVAGVFDAIVGYWPGLKKGNSALVHGVIRGEIKPERLTPDVKRRVTEEITREVLQSITPPEAVSVPQ